MQQYRVHYILPKDYRTRSVIVRADSRDEAKWVAPIQFQLPHGTRILEANPYRNRADEGMRKVISNETFEAQLYHEVLERIRGGYYDRDTVFAEYRDVTKNSAELAMGELGRRQQQFRNEVGAIHGTPKGHEALLTTAERMATQFPSLTGKTTTATMKQVVTVVEGPAPNAKAVGPFPPVQKVSWVREWRVVPPHRLVVVMDWYRQLLSVAQNYEAAPSNGSLMEAVRPRDNRVGSRIVRGKS